MPLIEISTGRLIQEVEKRPVIYNTEHEFYKDKAARRNAWQEVGKAMFASYKEMPTAQQMKIGRAIMQRWKTARDAYIRCKTKNNPNSYSFYSMLRFIDKTKQRTSNTKDKPEIITSFDSNYDPLAGSSVEVEAHVADQTPKLKQEMASDTEEDIEEDQESISNENQDIYDDPEIYYDPDLYIDEPPPKKQKLLKKRSSDSQSEMSTVIKLLTDTTLQMKNDNMAFFMSMLPIIDKFNDTQKLMFRSEVIKVAANISKETNNPLPKRTDKPVKASRERGKFNKRITSDDE